MPVRGFDGSPDQNLSFLRKVLVTVIVVALVGAFFLLVRQAYQVLFLIFAALLAGIFFRGLAHMLSEKTPLSQGWALAVVVIGFVGLVAVGWWTLAATLFTQLSAVGESIPQALDNLRSTLNDSAWGRRLLQGLPDDLTKITQDLISRFAGAFLTTLQVIGSIVFTFFVGVYLAAQPRPYIHGFLRLVPKDYRDRAREILAAEGEVLKWWLIGRTLSLLVVGVLTAAGLALLGIPSALALGAIAAVLSFVPNFGPILSAIPAVLVAMTESGRSVVHVLVLYLAVQTVESYLITPFIQRRAVSLPPALIITAQVLLWTLFGVLGLVFATPLTAALIVFVDALYIEDVLEEPVRLPGEKAEAR